jgi:hypothetical protein
MIDVNGNLYALGETMLFDALTAAEGCIEGLEEQNAILSNNLANAEHAYNKRGERIDDLISQLSVAKIWLENAREQLYVGKKADRRNTADKIYSILQSFKEGKR